LFDRKGSKRTVVRSTLCPDAGNPRRSAQIAPLVVARRIGYFIGFPKQI